MTFDDFEIVREAPKAIAGCHPLRIYRSRFAPRDTTLPIEEWRYHFGFPKELVAPLCPLLETTVAWGEKHHLEEEGFWVWWLVITGQGDEVPWEKLNRKLDMMLKSYNRTLDFFTRAARGQERKQQETDE